MKRVVILVAVLLGSVVVSAVATTEAAEPVNLITNGGFEQGASEWEPDPLHSIVQDRKAAHSGSACLTGETKAPNKALRLCRSVPVKAGYRYEFTAWARATNKAKMVLFAVQPGQTQRRMMSAWPDLPPAWKRYSIPFAVEQDGILQIELISPSSYGAPAGKIWIDDISLYETKMPALKSISEGVGFNDEPALTATDDGSLYVAWNSFRDGFDSLQVARYELQGKSLVQKGAWQILGGPDTYLLSPQVVATGREVTVVYAAEVEKNWDIYAAPCGPDGPSAPVRVTKDFSVDVKPWAVWCGKTLCVAWESNRNGFRQIFVTSIRDGQVSKPIAISEEGMSSYAPSVALTDTGELYLAWYGFRDNNMDVHLRVRGSDGKWGEARRLTHAPTVDRHPILFSRGNEAWIVYENSQTTEYNVGRVNNRRLIVAKIDSDGLMAPVVAEGAKLPLDEHCEAPTPLFGSDGRLWMALLRPHKPRAGWDTFLTCFSNGQWEKPTPVSSLKGMDRRPILAQVGNVLVIALQSDDAPRSWSDLDQMARAKSEISLATIDVETLPDVAPIKFQPLVESEEAYDPGTLRIDRGEETPTPSIKYGGQTLNLYYGSLHEHSDVSVCNRIGDESIDENYQSMRDVTRHDFACLTDHGYNMNPYLWSYTAKMARTNHDPGRFITYLAEEWTSSFEEYSEKHPYGFYGHRNLVLADPYFPRWWNARNRQTPAEVWEDLRKMNANFIHIPHQLADTGNVPTDWDFADETAQPVAEIFQTRGSYEFRGTLREAKRSTPTPGYFIQDAWARGIVIGVIAAPDHGGGYGKACVFAPEPTREAILDAIRARHCYGTTGAKIFLDVRVDGHLMGEKVSDPSGRSVEVEITVRCPMKIDRIEVCRNNQFIYMNEPKNREARLRMVDSDPLSGRSYYYVRVVQEDYEIAWSSPVWFGAK